MLSLTKPYLSSNISIKPPIILSLVVAKSSCKTWLLLGNYMMFQNRSPTDTNLFFSGTKGLELKSVLFANSPFAWNSGSILLIFFATFRLFWKNAIENPGPMAHHLPFPQQYSSPLPPRIISPRTPTTYPNHAKGGTNLDPQSCVYQHSKTRVFKFD